MKLIIITPPTFIPNESEQLNSLFAEGLEYLHLRKPGTNPSNIKELLNQIDSQFHSRISLHDCFEIAKEYNIGGLHINHRNPFFPENWKGRRSASCHSFKEIKEKKKDLDYLFLSPIFNSISKQKYLTNFAPKKILEAQKQGIIDNKVIALGGINYTKLPIISQWGFGGVALLGAIWNTSEQDIVKIFKELKKTAYLL